MSLYHRSRRRCNHIACLAHRGEYHRECGKLGFTFRTARTVLIDQALYLAAIVAYA